MINECCHFGAMIAQCIYIMAQACAGGNPFTSYPRANRGREKDTRIQKSSRAHTDRTSLPPLQGSINPSNSMG